MIPRSKQPVSSERPIAAQLQLLRGASEFTMTEADTATLVARAVAGEDGAFDRLVRTYHAVVYRWALVVAADPDEADDLTQAVWIKAHRSLGSFRGDAKFSSWLYRITYTTAIEFGRKR